ncbi:MAG: hypothetical protein ABJP45_18615 [Cyclobacteriaceae bacterium]
MSRLSRNRSYPRNIKAKVRYGKRVSIRPEERVKNLELAIKAGAHFRLSCKNLPQFDEVPEDSLVNIMSVFMRESNRFDERHAFRLRNEILELCTEVGLHISKLQSFIDSYAKALKLNRDLYQNEIDRLLDKSSLKANQKEALIDEAKSLVNTRPFWRRLIELKKSMEYPLLPKNIKSILNKKHHY